MLRYVVRIWEQVVREQPGRSKLPPILPYVLFHGAKTWTSARSLREAIDSDGLPPSLIALQPQMAFVLDDLAEQADTLAQRRLSVHALLPLLHLQHIRGAASTTKLLRQWRDLYRQLQGDPSGQEILTLVVSYVAVVSNQDPQDLRDAYALIGKSTEETFMTAADKLIQQGITQGITTGKHEGQAQMLAMLMEQRCPATTILGRGRQLDLCT